MNTLNLASFEETFAPIVDINKIAISYAEKLVEMNLAVLNKQAEVALASWKSLLSLKDPAEIQGYVAARSDAASELIEGYAADANTVTQLNKEVAEDVRRVLTEGIEKAAKKAA
jgi:phasin family protein